MKNKNSIESDNFGDEDITQKKVKHLSLKEPDKINMEEMDEWVQKRVEEYKHKQLRGREVDPAMEMLLDNLAYEEYALQYIRRLRLQNPLDPRYTDQISKIVSNVVKLMQSMGIEPKSTHTEDKQFNNLAKVVMLFDGVKDDYTSKKEELENEEQQGLEKLKIRYDEVL